MRSTYEEHVGQANEIQRTLMQGTARLCSCSFGIAWKALYPHKSAEELAARVGCSVRAAAYELSGEREPSPQSILVFLQEITPKRKRG